MKNVNIDIKRINELINRTNKILKNIHILFNIIIIYIMILILFKLNILYYIKEFLYVLIPLFIGIFTSWLLRPIVNYFESKGIKRIISLVIVYLSIIFIFIISLSTFIPNFIKELLEFINILNNIFSNYNISILKLDIHNIINTFIIDTSKEIPITFINIIKGISGFLIGFIISFYLLLNSITINTTIKKDTYELIMKVNYIFRNYFKGVFLSSIIIFILTTIIFYIIKLESPIIFGFICGITNVIPIIGPYIGGIIPVLVTITDSITLGIIVIILIFLIQTIDGNIIQPIIMHKNIKIHPVLSIISILVFGYFFKIFGMIFAIPIVVSSKEIYLYIRKRYKKISN